MIQVSLSVTLIFLTLITGIAGVKFWKGCRKQNGKFLFKLAADLEAAPFEYFTFTRAGNELVTECSTTNNQITGSGTSIDPYSIEITVDPSVDISPGITACGYVAVGNSLTWTAKIVHQWGPPVYGAVGWTTIQDFTCAYDDIADHNCIHVGIPFGPIQGSSTPNLSPTTTSTSQSTSPDLSSTTSTSQSISPDLSSTTSTSQSTSPDISPTTSTPQSTSSTPQSTTSTLQSTSIPGGVFFHWVCRRDRGLLVFKLYIDMNYLPMESIAFQDYYTGEPLDCECGITTRHFTGNGTYPDPYCIEIQVNPCNIDVGVPDCGHVANVNALTWTVLIDHTLGFNGTSTQESFTCFYDYIPEGGRVDRGYNLHGDNIQIFK